MTKHPTGYWATHLYLSPRSRPKADQPIRDLPPRAAQRFKQAREALRALRHVTEQVVYLGTMWKWVWMYEVGGRKLGYLHPMQSGVSGTFVLTEIEEHEISATNGLPRIIKQAVRDGVLTDGVRHCWMQFPDLGAVGAFVDVVRLKYQLLARPE
ncbi:MAG TPA: hypothetical protein VGQ06_13155 [Gemmatimonadales bacterium]|jgi:hypothetical protein|nr:hypothetical protein [Gemmatimonadales bacterium]